MIRPKVVLFDLGKVLVDFDWFIAARRISDHASATPDEVIRFIATPDLMIRYETGRTTSEEFFEEVRQGIGYRRSYQDFRMAFSDIFTEITNMVQLHARVGAAGIPTWIFSNTNDWAITHIRERFPFFATFDGYFLSYQLGALKPQPAIYESAESTTGCRGDEILYIDDIAENTAAAAARGWQTVHHVSVEETISVVDRILGLRSA